MPLQPLINAPNVNPLIASADPNFGAKVAQGWNQKGNWDILDYAAFESTQNLVDVLPIPVDVPGFSQRSPGGGRKVNPVDIGTITVAQKDYETTISLPLREARVPQLKALFELQKASLHDVEKVKQRWRRTFVNLLIANASQTYTTGVNFFSASQPVSPHQPWVLNQMTGLNTQPNLFTTTAFTPANIGSVIGKMMLWANANGEPFNPTDFTIFVAPPLLLYMSTYDMSQFLGISSLSGGSDTTAQSNPILAVRQEGMRIKFAVMAEYSGPSTDWYVTSGLLPPVVVRESQPPTAIDVVAPEHPIPYDTMATQHSVDMAFGMNLTAWWSMAKCTA
jgi:hypothetical protein